MYTIKDSKFTLSDLENMLPYEREIYVNLMLAELKDDIERKKVNG
jgi:hypothetical protein